MSCLREPSSLVKPLKENATDEEKAAYQEKLTAATSKANRIIVLVRHGQYNLQVGYIWLHRSTERSMMYFLWSGTRGRGEIPHRAGPHPGRAHGQETGGAVCKVSQEAG